MEEQRVTLSDSVSNTSPSEVSKIEPATHKRNDPRTVKDTCDSTTHEGPTVTMKSAPRNDTMDESSQHIIDDSAPTMIQSIQVDHVTTDTNTSCLVVNAATPADTASSAAVTNQQILKSNRDEVTSVPQSHDGSVALNLNVSVGGNDRITLDQPPNVALVPNTSSDSRQIIADIRHTVKTDSTSDQILQDVVAVVTNTKVDDPNLPVSTQTIGTDVAKKSSTLKPPPSSSGTTFDQRSISRSAVLSSSAALSNAPCSHPVTVGNRSTSNSISYSLADDHVPTMQQTAQQAAEEEAIAASRAPLANLYGSYLCHSKDASLADARKRLRNAITQTRSLRQTFTERVYGKYRVCLRPPPTADEIIANIEADPLNQLRNLKDEITTVREEKEIEKKEAAKLNNEMNQSNATDRVPVLSNIDNAEQLMFLTAGLNLVILPEDQSEEQLRAYAEAYSHSSTTGRTRSSISQAAATAGAVILDRTRKAAAMRVERQRRRQLQLLRGEVVADGESENNYSRLQVLKIAGGSSTNQNVSDRSRKNQSASTCVGTVKQTQSSSRRTPAASSKGGRSRSQSSLPTSTLLSINPSADEVKMDGNPSAATLALIARGVGHTMAKSTQQRLRHPHPDSLGGRRRANMNPGNMRKDDDVFHNPPEPFLQSNLANTLPPLPASKDRLERKRIPEEILDTASSRMARHSVKSTLDHFYKNSDVISPKPVTKIDLLNGIRKQIPNNPRHSTPLLGEPIPSTTSNAPETTNSAINPSLTISVLYALGIVCRSETCSTNAKYTLPSLNIENKALCSERLISLKGKIATSRASLTLSIDRYDEGPHPTELSRKRTRSSNNDTVKKQEGPPASADTVDKESCNVDSVDRVTVLDNSSTATNSIAANNSVRPNKRQRSSSSPTHLSNARPQLSSEQLHSQRLATTTPLSILDTTTIRTTPTQFTQSSAINMFQFANQFGHMHHPAAGDLAEYLGSFQQHQLGYDFPTGTVASPLSVFGLMQSNPSFAGYTIQERVATARAMIIREQQAAAILGGYQLPPAAVFPQLQVHPFAINQNIPSLVGRTEIQLQPIGGNVECPPSSQVLTEAPRNEAQDKSVIMQTITESKTELAPNIKIGDAAGSGKLLFIAPTVPTNFPSKHVERIQAGLFHLVVEELDAFDSGTAVDFLLSVGSAIPIPKALILAPLKDRLSTPGFKNASGSSTPLITRDVVAATILVWLWASHEQTFQQAFDTNGRIDVDADCKWLIQAAVDTAVGELSLEIAESIARGEGKFAEVSSFKKTNPVASPGGTTTTSEMSEVTRKLDSCTAAIVSKALSTEMYINMEMNCVIPSASLLVDFLDEARLGALRVKSQERTLLATLIARNSFLSENHAHAYVSSMVRAGEALKHGRLFEIAQDEPAMASTMIPYDIFTDDTGAWEDPCKPDDGFTVGLSGDELVRRAHARAMIQKSLRKLQDRHHIRGGTATCGPFVDSESGASRTSAGAGTKDRPLLTPQRPGLKRRISSMMEPPVVPGTGSAPAKSWAVYHPRHVSVPLEWDRDDVENLSYGVNAKNRYLPSSNRRNDQDISGSNRSIGVSSMHDSSDRFLHQSTSEINWVDVASTFQSVEVPRKSSRYKVVEPETHVTVDGTIFAPFYQEIQGDLSTDDSDGESTDEEDLSETNVLARHQIVLDSMKSKLEAYLEARKKQQERRKNKYMK